MPHSHARRRPAGPAPAGPAPKARHSRPAAGRLARLIFARRPRRPVPNLFVDIETAPRMSAAEYLAARARIDGGELHKDSPDRGLYWAVERGALTPFEGKVIVITYKINDGSVFRLAEWDGGEAGILRRFYNLVGDLQRGPQTDRLRIIGHNILRFDLFFLYARMAAHHIDAEKWLHRRLLDGPDIVDFLQLHLALNGMSMKGLRHDVLARAYGLDVKGSSGADVVRDYFEEEYERILAYSEAEFVYPEMYGRIAERGLVSREQLEAAIRADEEEAPEGGSGPPG